MKISGNKRLMTWLGLSVGVVVLAGCESTSMGGMSNGPMAMQKNDPMAMQKMAMDNMQRIMMMPENERMQHMMQVQQASLARGKFMFHDAKLGTNGQSCATCHINGGTTGGKVTMMPGMSMPIPTLLSAAPSFPKYKITNDAVITLQEMNNNCIVMFEKGKPLTLGSQEARDLAAYVTSLK